MAWSDGIDGVHRDIAAEPRAPVHVLAGPGTGKTFAMIRRIARLLEAGVVPEKILAVSFTRTVGPGPTRAASEPRHARRNQGTRDHSALALLPRVGRRGGVGCDWAHGAPADEL